MKTIFFQFKDMKIKITRPIIINDRDKDIGNRAYELLKERIDDKGTKKEDNWTREMDELFKQYDIRYERATEYEFNSYLRKANNITARIPGKGELSISK